MNRIKATNETLCLAVACLAALAVSIPVAVWGVPNMTDLPQHFRFAQVFYDSLAGGHAYPGWAAAENFGYGDIGVRFYPPLEYLFLALLRGVFGDWYNAARFNFAFWMVLGNVGIYLWAKFWLTPKESAIAACVYSFIPLHLIQLYGNFNNYSELAATSIMLFCFVFLTKVLQRGRAGDVLGLAISFALLILTHLPLTIIGSLCFGFYALSLARGKDFFRSMIKAGAAFAVGSAASAFYWVGMLTEMSWLNHTIDKFTSGLYNYKNGFFPFTYFADESTMQNFSYTYFVNDSAVLLSLAFLASAAIYVIYKKRGRQGESETARANQIYKFVLPVGLFALFMVTPLSGFVWAIFTPLQKVQFPARWLPVVAMSGALVAAASLPYLFKGGFLRRRIWLYGCILILTATAFFNTVYLLSPTSFIALDRKAFDDKMRELPETQSFNCWWTIWSKNDAFKTKEKISADGRAASVLDWQPEARTFEVAAGENNATARIATFYYPHWRATVNDKPVVIKKDENGVMLVPVTGEKSTIKIQFQEPLAVKIASAVSLFAWLFLGAGVLFIFAKKLFASRKTFAPASASPAAVS